MSKQQRHAVFALRRAGWSRPAIAKHLNAKLIDIYRALAEGEDNGKLRIGNRKARY